MCATSPSNIRVLVVDDDPATVAVSAALLTANGCAVSATHDPNAALAAAPVFRPDVLLTDVAMPGMLGVELACKVVEAVPTCRVVFHTGEARLIRDCGLAGALPSFAVLEKPVAVGDLLREVIGLLVRKHPPVSTRMHHSTKWKLKQQG
jgi:two-component system cell cycle sensor histidine kinase/response regulator CckA